MAEQSVILNTKKAGGVSAEMEEVYARPTFVYSFVFAWQKSDKTGSPEFIERNLRQLVLYDGELCHVRRDVYKVFMQHQRTRPHSCGPKQWPPYRNPHPFGQPHPLPLPPSFRS